MGVMVRWIEIIMEFLGNNMDYKERVNKKKYAPITSHVDLGKTTPVFGRIQYFVGFLVFT